MTKRAAIAKELEKISIHCFDLMKYRRRAERLNCSVWANYRGQLVVSGDILIEPSGFCDWNGHKWVLKRNVEMIKSGEFSKLLTF